MIKFNTTVTLISKIYIVELCQEVLGVPPFPKILKQNYQLHKILNGNAQMYDCSPVSGKKFVKIK